MKKRKSIRLQGFDYTQPAAYFITICAYQFQEQWGQIQHAEMIPNKWGEIIQAEWARNAEIQENLSLGAYVLMPNHLHGIIVLHPKEELWQDFYYPNFYAETPDEKKQAFGKIVPHSIPFIIKQFKSTCTKQVRELGFPLTRKHWQRGYYERVIRNPKELERITNYIHNNPLEWEKDVEYFKKLLAKMDLRV